MTRRLNPALVIGGLLVGIVVAVALVSFVWTPYAPTRINASDRLLAMSWTHPMGTDKFGRDILSRVLLGTRVSMRVGAMVVLLSGLLGVLLGGFAGYALLQQPGRDEYAAPRRA